MLMDCAHAVKIAAGQNEGLERLLGFLDTAANYEVLHLLAKGGHSEVFVVREAKTGRVYALKKIQKMHILNDPLVNPVMKERASMISGRNSRWLLGLHKAFQDNGALYFLTDFISGGDLGSLCCRSGTLSEGAIRFFAGEILMGLQELHALGLIHRDIKPENVLIDSEGHIKLADFGSATTLDGSDHEVVVGTPDYVAPELLNMEGNRVTEKVDLWSLGVVMYELRFGITPFYEESVKETYKRIMGLRYTMRECSAALADLISRLLVPEEARLSVSEAMAHEFFAGFDFSSKEANRPEPVEAMGSEDAGDSFESDNFAPIDQGAPSALENLKAFVGFGFDPELQFIQAGGEGKVVVEVAGPVGGEEAEQVVGPAGAPTELATGIEYIEAKKSPETGAAEQDTCWCACRQTRVTAAGSMSESPAGSLAAPSANPETASAPLMTPPDSFLEDVSNLSIVTQEAALECTSSASEEESETKRGVNSAPGHDGHTLHSVPSISFIGAENSEVSVAETLSGTELGGQGEIKEKKSQVAEENELATHRESSMVRTMMAVLARVSPSLDALEESLVRSIQTISLLPVDGLWLRLEQLHRTAQGMVQHAQEVRVKEEESAYQSRKLIRKLQSELRDSHTRIDREVEIRAKLAQQKEELAGENRELKEQLRRLRLGSCARNFPIKLYTEKKWESTMLYLEEDYLRIRDIKLPLNKIYFQNLKKNELLRVNSKGEALSFKLLLPSEEDTYTEQTESSSDHQLTAREEQELKKELAKETAILEGLDKLLSVVTGESGRAQALKQKAGTEKKIREITQTLAQGVAPAPGEPGVIKYHNHNFRLTTFSMSLQVWCQECNRPLYGLAKQGLLCKGCRMVCHKECHTLVGYSCELYLAMEKGTSIILMAKHLEDKERIKAIVHTGQG